jgi:hypothetical protein
VTKDGVEALTPSSSSLAMESEEALESVQGQENEENDATNNGYYNFSFTSHHLCLEY